MNNPFGFLIIDKPAGITSHDCVNIIRKVFNTRRVGHGGTLDPAVTGVLPIAIGTATRLFKYLPGDKTYTATIQLGKRTSTDDINGELISKRKWPPLETSSIEKNLNSFRGIIQQQPPLISSVHHRGERAYKRARKGEIFELPFRTVTIHKLRFCKWEQETGQLELDIHCSSGTYIRSLARDLGEKLDCGGCLLKLRRTQAQGFKEQQSVLLPKFNHGKYSTPSLLNPLDALEHLPKIKLTNAEDLTCWRRGQELNISGAFYPNQKSFSQQGSDCDMQYVALIDTEDSLAGIGEWSPSLTIKPKVVFNAYG